MSQDPQRELIIPREISALAHTADELKSLVEEIEKRLSPILRIDAPEENKSPDIVPPYPPLAGEIYVNTLKLAKVAKALVSIISRVEL